MAPVRSVRRRDLGEPAYTVRGDTGFDFQHDEHIYLNRGDAADPRGLNVIVRFRRAVLPSSGGDGRDTWIAGARLKLKS